MDIGLIDDQIDEAARKVGGCLKAKKMRLITAESCTGGTLAGAVTSVPGSSLWCEGGFITYSNAMKTRCLGVSEQLFKEHGAVSCQVVEAMAKGALIHSLADVSVAVSGVAGPDGGTVEKPVGTVWMGWGLSEQIYVRCFHFRGSRDQIRKQSVLCGLNGVLTLCVTGELCFN